MDLFGYSEDLGSLHQRLNNEVQDEALDIIQEEPTRIARLQENARQLAREVEKTLQGSSFMLREGEEQAPFRSNAGPGFNTVSEKENNNIAAQHRSLASVERLESRSLIERRGLRN